MTKVAAVLLLLLYSAVAQETTEAPCDLNCQHNTTCVKGAANFTDHPRPDGQPLDIHIDVRSRCKESLVSLVYAPLTLYVW